MPRKNLTFSPATELTSLEAQLAGTLKPLRPSRDMIQRLRTRIQFPNRDELARRLGGWRRLFFVFGGVMSGMLLFITLARAFYYMAGRKG